MSCGSNAEPCLHACKSPHRAAPRSCTHAPTLRSTPCSTSMRFTSASRSLRRSAPEPWMPPSCGTVQGAWEAGVREDGPPSLGASVTHTRLSTRCLQHRPIRMMLRRHNSSDGRAVQLAGTTSPSKVMPSLIINAALHTRSYRCPAPLPPASPPTLGAPESLRERSLTRCTSSALSDRPWPRPAHSPRHATPCGHTPMPSTHCLYGCDACTHGWTWSPPESGHYITCSAAWRRTGVPVRPAAWSGCDA